LINTGENTIYIGHLAVALAAKAATDKVPVGVLILAAYSNDILKLGFKAIGLETSGRLYGDLQRYDTAFSPGYMPWSHGLFMSVVWALLATIIAYIIFRDQGSAIVIGLVVVSHWFVDFIVHPAELPIFFSSSHLFGLGLWTTATGFKFSMFLELVMMVGGLTIYFVQRRKRAMTLAKNSH
jgi:hypothetical protein